MNFRSAAALAAVIVPNWAARPAGSARNLAPVPAANDLAREPSQAPELVPARDQPPAIARNSAVAAVQADQGPASGRAQELAPAARRPATWETF